MRVCQNCSASLEGKRSDAKYCSKLCRPPCSVAGCSAPVDSGGECRTHAQRRRRYGDPLALKRPQFRQYHCNFTGCTNKHVGHGYCPTHRMRVRRHGDVNVVHDHSIDRGAVCIVPGCLYEVGKYGNLGMCRKHARRAQRAARPAHYRAMLDMRRRRVKQATPPWADLEAIYQFYLACPDGHEVDHIIPLVHPKVSGLHVLENLQYLPEVDNRRKGNRLPPDAFDWVYPPG